MKVNFPLYSRVELVRCSDNSNGKKGTILGKISNLELYDSYIVLLDENECYINKNDGKYAAIVIQEYCLSQINDFIVDDVVTWSEKVLENNEELIEKLVDCLVDRNNEI